MKLFYQLFTGEIFFRRKGDTESGFSSVRQNTVIRCNVSHIAMGTLATAQQKLIKVFATNLGAEAFNEIEVVDVILLNISPLGEMTEEEFNALGMSQDDSALAQQAADSLPQ